MTPEDEALRAEAACRLHASYYLAGGATEAEFLNSALGAASAQARAFGPLDEGFDLDAMNLSDEWDSATDDERGRLRPAVQALARRAAEASTDNGQPSLPEAMTWPEPPTIRAQDVQALLHWCRAVADYLNAEIAEADRRGLNTEPQAAVLRIYEDTALLLREAYDDELVAMGEPELTEDRG